MRLGSIYACHRHGGNAFTATDGSECFVCGGFDSNVSGGEAERVGNVFFHLCEVGGDTGIFGDYGGIHIVEGRSFGCCEVSDFLQDHQA